MKFKNVFLDSIGYDLPPEIWSSEDVEKKLSPLYERLKLPYGRLELMTGIKERRFWPVDTKPSEIAIKAAERTLEKSKLNPDELDLLIHCSVCRDRMEPATASYVHKALGLSPKVQVFDVSNACLGFLNAVIVAGNMIDSGNIKNALIVSGENGRGLMESTLKLLLNGLLSRNEIKPYFANLTIGSGGVAAVLTDKASGIGARVVGGIVETDTQSNSLCEGGQSGDDAIEMQTDSEALLEAGIAVANRAWGKFQKQTKWTADTPSRFICHQVGRRHLIKLYECLNLDLKKDYSTFEKLGNMGSASLPVTLAMALESGAIRENESAALLGIGSGLSSIMLGMEF